jgi:hypothetical protein
MAGLVHAVQLQQWDSLARLLPQNPARSLSAAFPWRTAWMAGTSPAITHRSSKITRRVAFTEFGYKSDRFSCLLPDRNFVGRRPGGPEPSARHFYPPQPALRPSVRNVDLSTPHEDCLRAQTLQCFDGSPKVVDATHQDIDYQCSRGAARRSGRQATADRMGAESGRNASAKISLSASSLTQREPTACRSFGRRAFR